MKRATKVLAGARLAHAREALLVLIEGTQYGRLPDPVLGAVRASIDAVLFAEEQLAAQPVDALHAVNS